MNAEQTESGIKTPQQKDYAIAAFLACLIIGIFILPYYRYQINPDGVSYISIAKKYLAGNLSEAVNGYWSPLYSWLLTPLLFIGAEPLLAAKVLNLFVGSLIIFVIARITRRLSISVGTRNVLLLAAIPMILLFSMMLITPDLLVTLLMLIYFLITFETDYPSTKRNGMLCGFWGGVAYLAKSYSLPFFICHFTLVNFLHYVKRQDRAIRSKIIANFFCGFAVFSIISGIWITILSSKYHTFVYATAGGNHLMSLISHDKEPMYYHGFLAPPNQTAISAWEDPSFFTFPRWSPVESFDAFKYYARYVKKNFYKIYDLLKQFSFLSLPIIIASSLFLLKKPKKILSDHQIFFPVISVFLFLWGYSLIIVEERYLWVTFFLILILGGCIIEKLFQNSFFTPPRKAALYIFFLISIYQPVIGRLPYMDRGESIYPLSQKLKETIHPGDRIASNKGWGMSLFIAYYLDASYYGIPKDPADKETLDKELHKYHINHYLIWDNGKLVKVESIH
jgi:hypothetical protein